MPRFVWKDSALLNRKAAFAMLVDACMHAGVEISESCYPRYVKGLWECNHRIDCFHVVCTVDFDARALDLEATDKEHVNTTTGELSLRLLWTRITQRMDAWMHKGWWCCKNPISDITPKITCLSQAEAITATVLDTSSAVEMISGRGPSSVDVANALAVLLRLTRKEPQTVRAEWLLAMTSSCKMRFLASLEWFCYTSASVSSPIPRRTLLLLVEWLQFPEWTPASIEIAACLSSSCCLTAGSERLRLLALQVYTETVFVSARVGNKAWIKASSHACKVILSLLRPSGGVHATANPMYFRPLISYVHRSSYARTALFDTSSRYVLM